MKRLLLATAFALIATPAFANDAAPADEMMTPAAEVTALDEANLALPEELDAEQNMYPGQGIYVCYARNWFGRTYAGRDAWNARRAANKAMRKCQRSTPIGYCRFLGCEIRRW